MTRRSFALITAASARRIIGANDRVRVGLIGCGGRGRYVARFMREAPNVEFVAMCDVYSRNAEAGANGPARRRKFIPISGNWWSKKTSMP